MCETVDRKSRISQSLSKLASRRPHYDPVTRRLQISHSTLSTDGIKQLVARCYDFNEPLECLLFARGVNDIYLISIQNRQFALRVSHSNWRSWEAIMGELSALEHFGGRGAEVALPVRRADGDWITDIRAPEGLRRAVLFQWANGREPEYTNPTDARRYGRHLAELHAAADDMPPSAARPQLNGDYLVRCPLELIRPRMNKMPAVSVRLEAFAERLLAQLTRAEESLEDWGFCHGDVHEGNARISGERLVSFDFDACATGWRVYDLASYKWAARYHGVEEQAWQPFVDGYLQIRPSAAASLEFVGLFTMLRHLWMLGHWNAFSAVVGRRFLSDEFLETLVPFCEDVESGISGGSCKFPRMR